MSAPMYQVPYGAPYGGSMPPAELQTLRSMLNIARILALILMIVFVLVGVAALAWAAFTLIFWAIAPGVFALVGFAIALVIWYEIGEIQAMVDRGQYQAAKDKTLIWMILGFIFGWFITGIVLLLAYLKFDPLINWQRAQYGQQQVQPTAQPPVATAAAPGYAAPPAATSYPSTPPMASSAPPMPTAPAAPPPSSTCPRCGRQIVWVGQYGRWFCYGEQTYL